MGHIGKTLAAERGSPRGRHRLGFETDRMAKSYSSTDRETAAQNLAERRPNLGWSSHRNAASSTEERSKLNRMQQNQLERLGMHSARDTCPESVRRDLKRLSDAGLARLGCVSERDEISASERQRLRDKMTHERVRKAWDHVDRSVLSSEERKAWDDTNDQRRSNAGMVCPYLADQSMSEHERTRLRDHHGYEQAYERSRLGFIKERDATPAERRDVLVEAKNIERLRLGFCEERTCASDPVWRGEKEAKGEERNRLGFCEDSTKLDSARRHFLAEGAFESRSRLGMLVYSPRHPLSSGDPTHRDVSTAAMRAQIRHEGDVLRARSGMTNERTVSTGSIRTDFVDKQRDQRERLGFLDAASTPRTPPVLRERNGRKAQREVTCKI